MDEKDSIYLLGSDRYLRMLDKDYRVCRKRKWVYGSDEVVLMFFDRENENSCFASPLSTSRWQAGEKYIFDTDEIKPLTDVYSDMGDGVLKIKDQSDYQTRVYALDHGLQIIYRDDPGHLSYVEFTNHILIFGCSFKGVSGDLTEDDRMMIYMDGGIIYE